MCAVHWGGPNANLVVYLLEKASRGLSGEQAKGCDLENTQFSLCVLNGVFHRILSMRNRQYWIYSP